MLNQRLIANSGAGGNSEGAVRRFSVTPEGARSLDRLPEKILAAVAETVYGPLAENPERLGRSLVGALGGLRVARRGDYRIIYEIDEDERLVIVHRVKHRRNVYRRR